ncbi:MAG: hypothetical protein IKE01_03580 [Clostridia bacterium]|nr:hypothetical protein [Clostridia bacterium]
MFKEKFGNLKNALIKSEKKDNKKSIENLIVFVVILVISVIAINYIWNDDKKKNKNSNKVLAEQNIINESNNTQTGKDLEDKLGKILSGISGVGEVKVLITYAQTSVVNPVYNEDEQESVTEETDTGGGKRTISSKANKKEVAYSNNDIITKSVTSPQIQGAIVIAKGAGNSKVKTDIIQAVEAATGLSTYKIQVFEMN